jgi:thioredoxin reductase (NADPH)
MVNDNYDPAHGHEFDLVVIGGGSGGLACSKEAKNLGAKVAVLDFVKPSSHGSKWGLGGTCVNVGCIPKKLMHQAALLGESYHDATAGFGWEVAGAGPDAKLVNNWEVMRERVQDHIKGLNFGYRVQLREQGVQYLNKLGKFTGPNTLECIDAKGRSKTITAARFVIAVGGRPTPLSCPGGEFAISSDDLFSLEKSPGKTCVVGAGYVALECAGFIAGLHQGDVTVLVRSIPLRGFDRDIVEKVQSYMEGHKIKIVSPVTPTSIEKLPSGQLQVQFSNGESDTFDTVLCAVGRSADTSSLGLETVGVTTNSNNGKISCKNEQTNVPHVYAIGDVVANAPELTPVAILAGKLLARRLFGDSTEVMNYKDVATAVFTPLEIGTVGLSEEDAITKYGAKVSRPHILLILL